MRASVCAFAMSDTEVSIEELLPQGGPLNDSHRRTATLSGDFLVQLRHLESLLLQVTQSDRRTSFAHVHHVSVDCRLLSPDDRGGPYHPVPIDELPDHEIGESLRRIRFVSVRPNLRDLVWRRHRLLRRLGVARHLATLRFHK